MKNQFTNDDSKSQAADACCKKGNVNGDAHDFNIKGKVTNSGSGYGNMGSGIPFNGAEKDASIAYLQDRNKKGQVVRQFNATQMTDEKYGQGATAYDPCPIPETYKPATSNGTPDPDAVGYKTKIKSRKSY
jgi:hypothetical protein